MRAGERTLAMDWMHCEQIATLLREGLHDYGEGQVDAAVRAWARVLELDPGNADARDYIDSVGVVAEWAEPGPAEIDSVELGLLEETLSLASSGRLDDAYRLIEGGMPTEATVASVIVSKYADHLPLYRQAQIYSRQGVDLDRSTLASWVSKAAYELRPVYDCLLKNLKQSSKLFMDETTAPVLDPGRGKTKTGYFWALARDDRPWAGEAPPGVAFTYAPGRGGKLRMIFCRASAASCKWMVMPVTIGC